MFNAGKLSKGLLFNTCVCKRNFFLAKRQHHHKLAEFAKYRCRMVTPWSLRKFHYSNITDVDDFGMVTVYVGDKINLLVTFSVQ